MYKVFGNMTGFHDKDVEGKQILFLVHVVYLNVSLFIAVCIVIRKFLSYNSGKKSLHNKF